MYMDVRKTVVNSFVISRVDYCNSLLAGIPRYQLDRLQAVVNTAARLSAPRSRIISSTCCGTAFIGFRFRSVSKASCMDWHSRTSPTSMSTSHNRR